jgi:broad-specificity NMP kinase
MGYNTHDIDEVSGLCSWRNKKTGERGNHRPGIGKDWIDQHDWICDEAKLKDILIRGEGPTIVCGIASNQKELLPLFGKVILLTLNDDLLKQRLSSRTGEYDFAKTESEQMGVLEWKDDWEQETIKAGAIPIDTDKPLDKVVQEIVNLISGYNPPYES